MPSTLSSEKRAWRVSQDGNARFLDLVEALQLYPHFVSGSCGNGTKLAQMSSTAENLLGVRSVGVQLVPVACLGSDRFVICQYRQRRQHRTTFLGTGRARQGRGQENGWNQRGTLKSMIEGWA